MIHEIKNALHTMVFYRDDFINGFAFKDFDSLNYYVSLRLELNGNDVTINEFNIKDDNGVVYFNYTDEEIFNEITLEI